MATTPQGLYPFATRDGQSIPLDIIQALGLIKFPFAAAAFTEISIPATFNECMVYSLEGCIMQPGVTLAYPLSSGIAYNKAVLILPNAPTTCVLTPGINRIIPLQAAGSVYIQAITKWAGLALSQQFTRA